MNVFRHRGAVQQLFLPKKRRSSICYANRTFVATPVSTRPNSNANDDFAERPVRIIANPHLSLAVRNAQESSDPPRGNKTATGEI
jgi:hypothetical protein